MAETKSQNTGWLRTLVDLAVIVLIVSAAKTAIAEPFYVPSGSMEPTLLIGDELLATKYPYGYSGASLPSFFAAPNTSRIFGALPKRGDVVVFRWPGDRSQVWVKRVIGLPGDRIALRDGRVIINGEPVGLRSAGRGQAEVEDGSSTSAARLIETLPGGREHTIFKMVPREPLDNVDEIQVPPGRLFVMGDNRDNSADSRYSEKDGVGYVPEENLVGKAQVILFSWNERASVFKPWTWLLDFRPSRFFNLL